MLQKADEAGLIGRANAEDLILARRCASGDEVAMRTVFDLHAERLNAISFRLLSSTQDAEETVVSTFLKFWRHATRYRGDCTLKAFLTGICLNLCRDRLRSRKKTTLVAMSIDVSPRTSQEDHRIESVRQAMTCLSNEDREILTLYYLDGADYQHLGEALGVSYDVVRTRLVRARKRLRKALGVNDE